MESTLLIAYMALMAAPTTNYHCTTKDQEKIVLSISGDKREIKMNSAEFGDASGTRIAPNDSDLKTGSDFERYQLDETTEILLSAQIHQGKASGFAQVRTKFDRTQSYWLMCIKN